MNVKTFFLTAGAVFAAAAVSASSYRIAGVDYRIAGKTRIYALERAVEVDKNQIFAGEDELVAYISDFTQRLENTRAFDNVTVDFLVGGTNAEETKEGSSAPIPLQTDEVSARENALDNSDAETAENAASETTHTSASDESREILPVTLIVTAKDSHHLLIAPYPKYDSNNGFKMQIKIKDTNFLGSLETLTGDINFAAVQDSTDETKAARYKFGFGIDFGLPFKMGKIDSKWNNEAALSYTIGDKTPEWKLKTGLEWSLPYKKFPLNFEIYQSFIRNLDYEDGVVNGMPVHFGDSTYFVEAAKMSLPILVHRIQGWGNVYYTPYVESSFTWDHDGISGLNTDLQSPDAGLGHTISAARINWIDNFRTGISASVTQDVSYNFKTHTFSPGLSAELKIFKAFKYAGLAADVYGFAYMNSNKSIGARLRGIRDDQYFASGSGAEDKKACSTPAAIVLNADFPIRIFRAHWQEVPGIRKIPFAKYFDMELQLSPFVDIALIKNRATGTAFSYKDGFLSGGLEMLVYPLRWRGIEVRGSFGVDLGRKMPGIKGKMNQSWRKGVSAYEISVGIGLHY